MYIVTHKLIYYKGVSETKETCNLSSGNEDFDNQVREFHPIIIKYSLVYCLTTIAGRI